MARKGFRAVPVKKTPSPRMARPPATKARPAAHPRLVHGFLVRLTKRSILATAGTKPAHTAAPNVTVRTQRLSDTKHEGPADDATFH